MRRTSFLSLVLVTSASAVASQALAASTLPGGATSLNEAHADWSVRCGTNSKDATSPVRCTISQEQLQKNTSRRVLLVAVSPSSDGTAAGTLLMPFGLSLSNGVTMKVDDGQATAALPFRTCLPAGCIVQIQWDRDTIDALRGGKAVTLGATGDNGKATSFTVSLNGFGSALDRAVELTSN